MKFSVRGVTCVLLSMATTPEPGVAQNSDTTLARIERLIVAGDRSSGRFLADSLIATLPPESPHVAEALYWRAASAPSAANAERDYLRIGIEHPYSKRAPDALLALAQLEFARGDRASARRRFDKLLRDYPSGKHLARASLWSGRLALEDREYATACTTLKAGRSHVATDDVELRNQFDYFVAQCERLPASPDTAVIATAPDTARPAGPEFSIQVAAYTARVDATSLATSLKARGFDVRIFGSKAPYRVRVGRYGTRADATAALAKMKASRVSGMVVEAEPR